ncbi:mannose-1-phosphate guanylyltransferase [Aestuariimicrobium sp. p3-SID1156]|uniref:mannose-1-phosphate guanylyltransferase n=1 Tax=Aestuariimicrobium sp. p3-SID1156 TaxID=2916038 RepID=UPI00223B0968|nr:mannose-1-phosphate guanylyltransferase [Aestuariimicrobium sp. p3-SID1156]MCT1460004.1 mannose-1-phosphate guanylyltransferase [Aestuariimicrobium sp. p3-SID1156]
MRYVLIIAGGSGKRLWPLSRQGEPKQLLTLINGKSLLRIAYERVQGFVPDANIIVCTGAPYADTVAEQLPEIPAENLLGEPIGRDSLNAVAWPAAVIAQRDPDAVMAVLTADHIMDPVETFRDRLDEGFRIAEQEQDAFVTFGVVPTHPATGFGYLHRGESLVGFENAQQVESFKEKPDAETAEQYLASGQYWWNSGMFVWRVSTFLQALNRLQPVTFAQVGELAQHPERVGEIYPTLTKISVDYAIMEPVSTDAVPGRVVAVELPISWHDVGSFMALAEQLRRDGDDNAASGTTVALDSRHNLLINRAGSEHVLAVAGLERMAVVTTGQATLVVPLDASERVKDLVARVVEEHGETHG